MSSSPSTIRAQRASRTTATRSGETWTSDDLAFVTAFADDAHADIARALGRTVYAVESIKAAIRAGYADARTARVTRAHAPRTGANGGAYRGWTEGMGDE